MDRHLLAGISVTGTILDLLGGLYLAYDLLGGKHGPLRTLTRGITYSVLFGLGYGLPLGAAPGVAGGLSLGVSLAHEFSLAARGILTPPARYIIAWTSLRSVGFGIGLAFLVDVRFGVYYAVLSAVGQLFAYRIGFSPTSNFEPKCRPTLNSRQMLGVVNRTVGYTLAALICEGLTATGRGLAFALKIGLVIGLASALIATFIPYIEWTVERLPERRLGLFGAILVVIGFLFQSIQYWAILIDLPVR